MTDGAFTAGLFDATTTSNLGSSFGQTKCVWKLGQPAQNNVEVILTQKRNGISICPRLRDVLVQHKLSPSCQSCGVQIASGDLRDTYGQSFVIKNLDKIDHDCNILFSAR